MESHLRSLAVGTLLVGCLIPLVAEACCGMGRCACWGWPDEVIPDELVGPLDGEVDVPTNTGVWVSGSLQDAVRIETVDGVELDAAMVPLFSHNESFGMLTPREDLDPYSDYWVLIGNRFLSTFRTGAGPDREPPPAPVFGDPTSWSDEHEQGEVTLPVTHQGFMVAVSTVAHLEVADAEDSAFDVQHAVVSDESSLDARLGYGVPPCNARVWDSEAEESVSDNRFVAVSIDLAGNVSEPSEILEHQLPAPGQVNEGGEVGCHWESTALIVIVLFPVGWLRRR